MKLLTHNMLTSKCMKNVTTGYPLKIVANKVKECKINFDADYVQRILPKVDWSALKEAAENLNIDLPAEPPNASDEESLRKAHHALFEVEVIQGDLICPETGRKFPIKQGIPNMLLNEDEV